MEAVGTQAKELVKVPVTGVKELFSAPLVAIGMILFVLFVVLLVEAYKPGLFTGPVRKFLTAVGVKSA
jgi:hypothetical protein